MPIFDVEPPDRSAQRRSPAPGGRAPRDRRGDRGGPARDRELRGEIAALARPGIEAAGEAEDAAAERPRRRSLAKRALQRSEESARAGQRADAARWTGAARVFALRLRDARARLAGLEAEGRCSPPGATAESALAANVAGLNQVAVARLASLSARKAAKLQAAVDEAAARWRNRPAAWWRRPSATPGPPGRRPPPGTHRPAATPSAWRRTISRTRSTWRRPIRCSTSCGASSASARAAGVRARRVSLTGRHRRRSRG